MYQIAKHLHLTAVALSILLFILRFILMALNKPLANHKLLRIVPHIAYTLLIASAVWLCVQLGIYPFVTPWVTTKLIGLVLFVVCALWATQWAQSSMHKYLAFLLALASFAMTLHTAFSKQSLFF